MPLRSQALSGDPRLEACLTQDSAHLTLGVSGEFVAKVQAALMYLDGLDIDDEELDKQTYGKSTAEAVYQYKSAREIINRSYQQSVDKIVGKMTIKSLDDEMKDAEENPVEAEKMIFCCSGKAHNHFK